MKKFLLIIFLFLSCMNVFASERSFKGSEYIENVFYIKNNGSTIQYRRAQVIRDTVTGEIAYCIEPFGLMVDNSYYDEDTAYNSIYGISRDKWERIKLYAYYGYGYKDHTSIKWVNITQMSIWRTLYPSSQFDWLNNLDDKTVIYPFENEVNELNELVKNHYILPSFEKEQVFSVGEKIELVDTNNVLKNYTIINSNFDATISGNTLKINATDGEKEGRILLRRAGDVNNQVKYFYSSESQNVMERGYINVVNMEIKIKIKSGKIIVNKVDSETKDKTPQGEAILDGATFQLLNENKEVINELTTENNTLEFNSLPFGKYYIKEKQSGTGYYLHQKEYEIVIDKDNLEQAIDIENQVIKSKVRIIKQFGTQEDFENNKMSKEENIEFNIYDKDNNIIYTEKTNSDGIIEVELPYGIYTVEQINTTEGYEKLEKFEIVINEENSISYDLVLNDFKIEVPNAYIDSIKNFIYSTMELLYV